MAKLSDVEQVLILDGRVSDQTPVVIEIGNDVQYATVVIGNFSVYTTVDDADIRRLNAALRGAEWKFGKRCDTLQVNAGWLKWKLGLDTQPNRSVTFNLEYESVKVEQVGEVWEVKVFDDFDTFSADEYDTFSEALAAAYEKIAGRRIVSSRNVGISTIEMCEADQL